ncbi:DUF5723 family protein [Mangrovibacterium diazotrophicum]|uniref:DUF5723 domain-containing protein n=1 Tax=Mangrovibacterium diazotrophicum TaxID=1261403 RepID=A0A419W3E4_9BACT|nr:DUF5723 family protein [Mangrovibacterium diazotrophicum]RKD89988.1 hypothetical protein BC643_0322 [Mangrovibacterium diazotrophicum]
MKTIALLIALLLSISLHAQRFQGIHTSRFFPLQNIYSQPADLVRSDSRWNVNFLSTNIALKENFVFNESDYWDLVGKVGFGDLKYFFATEESALVAVGNVMLPSVSYKINHRNAVALTMRLRVNGIYKSSNSDLLKLFTGIDNPEGLQNLSNEYFKSLVNQWMEYSASWSGVLWENEGHLLTGGLNLKYLVGGGSGYLNMDGINVDYSSSDIDHFDVQVSYAYNKNLSNTISQGKIDLFGDRGVGLDFGLSYSYKPTGNDAIPYKYKVGFSISDVGYVKHRKEVDRSSFQVDIQNISFSWFSQVESMRALIDSLKNSVDFVVVNQNSYKMDLPKTFTLTGDYCFSRNWYVEGLISYQPGYYRRVSDIIRSRIWTFAVTPRFENLNWGVYLPFFHTSLSTDLGAAFRWKFFFMGSRNVLSNMLSSGPQNGEFYFGINIPIGKQE